ncbi:MAG: efflux RND transporter periplasmic adaptor subunit [Gammaproteobacteria bacterium]|nr:efflux RND transporter periplasmic adaptor subunit [Gammaproteobacteria bacterium]MBQ0838261.1 efflux RND transporter periplasmic adaptor subunit [Gammaproteobacteria bacterium]
MKKMNSTLPVVALFNALRVALCVALFTASLAPVLAMAETLAISAADIERLGIRFAPATLIDRHSGTKVAATVTHSPESSSLVTALYSGTLERWHTATGSSVKAGTVLASIKSQPFLDIQNQWISAKTTFQQAAFEEQKDRQLFSDGIIAGQRLQQTKNTYQQAKFHLQAMDEKLRQAGFSKDLRQQLSNGKITLGVYTISAPADGKLSQQAFNVGDYVDANSPVASLNKAELPWVEAQIPLSIAATLQIGQELSALGLSQSLVLKQKNMEVNPNTQTLEIRAAFSQPVELMVGQIIFLVLPTADAGILIPTSAIVHSGDDSTIYVLTSEGVEARNLQLQAAGENYLAREGIRAGEKLAVQGAALLKGVQLGLGEDE